MRRAGTLSGLLARAFRLDPAGREILAELKSSLDPFLKDLDHHLRTMSPGQRLDATLRAGRDRHLLAMLEIELTNRINRRPFLEAPWRMALLPHCLRDFREGCRARPGEVEYACVHCEGGCHIHLASRILDRHGVHPFISMSMDHPSLFRRLKAAHPEMGVLGVACLPELVEGLRLCEGLGIPAVGVPLDANRCSRWMGECLETTFSLEEMERIIGESVQV